MLADRVLTGFSILAALAVALASAIGHRPAPRSTPVPDGCPSGARRLAGLDGDRWASATVTCVHGNFGGPGWLVHAVYETTEWSESFGVISEDGERVRADFTDDRLMFIGPMRLVHFIDGDGVEVDCRDRIGRTMTWTVMPTPDGITWAPPPPPPISDPVITCAAARGRIPSRD